jgi:hypothetical protein
MAIETASVQFLLRREGQEEGGFFPNYDRDHQLAGIISQKIMEFFQGRDDFELIDVDTSGERVFIKTRQLGDIEDEDNVELKDSGLLENLVLRLNWFDGDIDIPYEADGMEFGYLSDAIVEGGEYLESFPNRFR